MMQNSHGTLKARIFCLWLQHLLICIFFIKRSFAHLTEKSCCDNWHLKKLNWYFARMPCLYWTVRDLKKKENINFLTLKEIAAYQGKCKASINLIFLVQGPLNRIADLYHFFVCTPTSYKGLLAKNKDKYQVSCRHPRAWYHI